MFNGMILYLAFEDIATGGVNYTNSHIANWFLFRYGFKGCRKKRDLLLLLIKASQGEGGNIIIATSALIDTSFIPSNFHDLSLTPLV